MTITVLPTPIYSRRAATAGMDAAGRFFTYNPAFKADCTGFDATVSGTAERYDPGSNSWTALAQSAERTQVHMGWVVSPTTGTAYRIGGRKISNTGAGSDSATFEIYDPIANTWSFGSSLPTVRSGSSAWIDSGGTLWVGGGSGGATNYTDMYKYVAGAWVAMASSPYGTFGQGAYSYIDTSGRAYFLGTVNLGGTLFQRYDPSLNTWTKLADLPGFTGAGSAAIDAAGGYLWALSPASPHALYRYSIAANTWTNISTPPSTTYAGALVFNAALNALFMFQSRVGTVDDLNIYKFDIAGASWSATGDAVSAYRSLFNPPVFDGTGYYIPQGSSPTNCAVNVVERFVPAGLAVATRSWVAVIG